MAIFFGSLHERAAYDKIFVPIILMQTAIAGVQGTAQSAFIPGSICKAAWQLCKSDCLNGYKTNLLFMPLHTTIY